MCGVKHQHFRSKGDDDWDSPHMACDISVDGFLQQLIEHGFQKLVDMVDFEESILGQMEQNASFADRGDILVDHSAKRHLDFFLSSLTPGQTMLNGNCHHRYGHNNARH